MMLLAVSHPAHGHHGRDFILVQDSAIPSGLGGVVMGGLEWTRDGAADDLSTEPGFFIGLHQALAFGINAGFSDSGDGWRYTGITPQIVISLPVPAGPLHFRAGFWTAYEFAERLPVQPIITTHGHDGGSGPDAPVPRFFSERKNHALPPTTSAQGSLPDGLTRPGESGWHNRLILEADVAQHTRAVVNLISLVSGTGRGPGFGYAAGLRHELNHDLALGLEAMGEFEAQHPSHQVLLTAMVGLPRHLSLRLGVGGGLTPAAPDFTLHTSFLWRF
jgi:hypothetical protein